MLTDHTIQVKLALEILQKKSVFWTRVSANNSKPLIFDGDMICLKSIEGELKVGDLVALDSLKMFIVQRILKINGDQFTTKADMSDRGPFTFERDKIVARAAIIKSGDKYYDIDTKTSAALNRMIASLSYNRSLEFKNKNLFYRPFFMRLKRSAMKRLLKLEKYLGKTDDARIDFTIQD